MFKNISLLAIIAGLTLIGCKPEIEAPNYTSGSANFSKVVYFGDGYLSGFQNGALYDKAQNHSIPALIADELKWVGTGPLTTAIIPNGLSVGPNSKPWDSEFVSRSALGMKTDCEGVEGLSPLKDELSSGDVSAFLSGSAMNPSNNVTLPFASSSELLSAQTSLDYQSGGNMYFHYMASAAGNVSPLQYAGTGTFAVVWIGTENILRYARSGGTQDSILPVAQFAAQLDSVMDQLADKGVIANIPDFRSMPYYTTIKQDGLELDQVLADSLTGIFQAGGANQHINFVEGVNSFITGDPLHPTGYRHMAADEYITLGQPVDSMKCNLVGVLGLIPDQYTLIRQEVDYIDQMVAAYNQVIAEKAMLKGWALVDAHSYLKGVESGVVWNGVDVSSEFVSGGFFGLDGTHPHEKGYSYLANEFIAAINATYGSVIPTVHCPECEAVRFP